MVESTSKTEEVPQEIINIMKPLAPTLLENSEPTEEQKKKMDERASNKEADEAFAKGVQDDASAIFLASDEDGDNMLNEAEFVNFYQKQKVATDGRGGFLPGYTEEQIKLLYEGLNQIDSGVEGINLKDIMIGRKALVQLLKQASPNAGAEQAPVKHGAHGTTTRAKNDPTVNNPPSTGMLNTKQSGKKNKGGRPALRVPGKAPLGRGSKDPKTVITTLTDAWDDLQDELEKLEQEERDLIKDHFNGCIDGEDELGDILFGDKEDFENRVNFLDEEPYKQYADEIEKEELLLMDDETT